MSIHHYSEDSTYDEALGPGSPRRRVFAHEWYDPYEAVDVLVGAAQQARFNITTWREPPRVPSARVLDNLERMRNDPTDERHGTPNGYINYRCRCFRCRAAHAGYRDNNYLKSRKPKRTPADRRAEQEAFAADLDDPRHGTNYGATYLRCGCELCLQNRRDYAREHRQKKRLQSAVTCETLDT